MRAPRLLLVTDPASDVLDVVRRALTAADGRVAVQLRDKTACARDLVALARALRAPCDAAGARLLVNDRVDVAHAAGADGVHLPERGLGVAEARAVLGPRALIGRSRHDRAGLLAAEEEGADYVTLGPIHAVPGKGAPMGIEGFSVERLPCLALGGVGLEDVAPLLARGAAGVAISRPVMTAEDPAVVVARFLAALTASQRSGSSAGC